MSIINAIFGAGEKYLGGGDSPIGTLVGSVVQAAGKDGWDGIVEEFANTESGVWGSINQVVKTEFGEEYGSLVQGVKGVVDGDYGSVAGAVMGGVRDYVGDDRFDVIAGTVGNAINGNTEGWWNETTGLLTSAVGNDTFTAIVDTVNENGGGSFGDDLFGSVINEFKGVVGEDTWDHFETAAGIHAELVKEDEPEEADEADQVTVAEEADQVTEVDEAEEAAVADTGAPTDGDGLTADEAAVLDEAAQAVAEAEDADAATDEDAGDAVGEADAAFAEEALAFETQIIQPAPGTGFAMDDTMEMGAGFPGGPPIGGTVVPEGADVLIPTAESQIPAATPGEGAPLDAAFRLDDDITPTAVAAAPDLSVDIDPIEAAPAPELDAAPVQDVAEVAPVSEFEADMSVAQSFESTADSFFEGIEAPAPVEEAPAPADDGFDAAVV